MNPRTVALWRFEQIEGLLDETLTAAERHALIKQLERVPVHRLSGIDRCISAATFYRWFRGYKAHGLKGLYPKPRRRRKRLRRLTRKVLEKAISLLREEPRRPLTMLVALIEAELHEKVSRSSLHRHLQDHRAYPALRRQAKGDLSKKLRRRFGATRPHVIWQCDSKGPFEARFSGSKKPVELHIFTILDDCSRAPLAVFAFPAANLRAAICVFRAAARRYGLPLSFYADRASIFDSYAFRSALAELGVRRIKTKSRNAPARGKIEAYHRALIRWFLQELRHQVIHDLDHLNRLLVGLIETVYMNHRHRTLRMSPRQALGGAISERQVSNDRLLDAFLIRTRKKSHPKTGEVDLGENLFKVPKELAGRKLDFAYDLEEPTVAFVEGRDGSRKRLALAVEPAQPAAKSAASKRGEGRLQALYDAWQGRSLPLAEAGFGIPELYELFSKHLGRSVPHDETEARLIQDFYRAGGPLSRQATESALKRLFSRLGSDRPLAKYLEALALKINPQKS
jgi:transposase InsO family protein